MKLLEVRLPPPVIPAVPFANSVTSTELFNLSARIKEPDRVDAPQNVSFHTHKQVLNSFSCLLYLPTLVYTRHAVLLHGYFLESSAFI